MPPEVPHSHGHAGPGRVELTDRAGAQADGPGRSVPRERAGDVSGEVEQPVGAAPLVVLPPGDLHQVSVPALIAAVTVP